MKNATIVVPEVHVVTVGEAGPRGLQGPPGADATSKVSAMNSGVPPMIVGQPVYMQIDGTVILANAVDAPRLVGLVIDPTIPPLTFGLIQTDGPMDATTAEWDFVTGGSGGLVAGSRYFLSVTPGKLVNIPDLANVVALVGRAASATRMIIDIDPPIFP